MKKMQYFRKTALILGLATFGFFTSCKDESNNGTTAEPSQTTTTPSQNETQQTAQVNPAHGLPGHRCDIPVGAPLNSASNSQQTTPQSGTQSSSVSPVRMDQSPRVNPPHGEPGHDCSIPVGAELKQQ